jgi:uncharacterized protein with gpF-like domain
MSEQKYKTEKDGKVTATFGEQSKGSFENPIAITDEEYTEIQENWKKEGEEALATKKALQTSGYKKMGLNDAEIEAIIGG